MRERQTDNHGIRENELLRKEEFVQRFEHLLTEPELNYLIKNRRHNGFAKAVRKVGQRKMFIYLPAVYEWINEQRG
ncbi:MAG: hypothetical protein WEB02_05760 [Methylophaga sp.]